MNSSNVLVGIIGGMGPQATIDLYQKIVDSTVARTDQKHIHVVIDSYPQIPDRTQALLYDGESPVPYLLESIQRLEAAGVTHIAMPCNTAHAFIPELVEHTDVTFINMITETARFVSELEPTIKSIGLLATTGTVKSNVYQSAFEDNGIACITLDEDVQESCVMQSIYSENGIKAGYITENTPKLLQAVAELQNEFVDAIVLGCTEIPLAINQNNTSVLLVDPTQILAERIVSIATTTQ